MEAADVMTPQVITVAPDASIFQAIRLMLQNRISGLPVMDAKGRLVGIVTEGDLFRRAETGTERHRSSWLQFFMSSGDLADEYVHTHGRKVEDVMSCKRFRSRRRWRRSCERWSGPMSSAFQSFAVAS